MKKKKLLGKLRYAGVAILVLSLTVVLFTSSAAETQVSSAAQTTVIATEQETEGIYQLTETPSSASVESTEPTSQEKESSTTTQKAASKKSSASNSVSSQKEERKFSVRNISVSAEGCSVSDSKLRYARSILENLPDSFYSVNVRTITFVDSIAGYGSNCHGLSHAKTQEMELCINNCSETLIKSVIYHEFGHFADFTATGFTLQTCFSYQSLWKTVLAKEKDRLFSYYPGLSSSSDGSQRLECFAMVFDAYYTGRISGSKVDIKSLCPEMYGVMEDFVAQYMS